MADAPKKTPLTDDQVKWMLEDLREHFGETVAPVSQYCATFRTWARCVEDRADRLRKKLFGDDYQEFHRVVGKGTDHCQAARAAGQEPSRREYDLADLESYLKDTQVLHRVSLLIGKSSLLGRLLYGGETLRTQMCPVHQGVWSGLEHDSNVCVHKCQHTGWVMAPEDEAKMRAATAVNWPDACELCSKPYVKGELGVCSSSFHCCRDCFWWEGEVYYPCADHMEEYAADIDGRATRREARWKAKFQKPTSV